VKQAWYGAATEFPLLATPSLAGAAPTEIDLRVLKDKPAVPVRKAVQWAFDHLDADWGKPADAPSAGPSEPDPYTQVPPSALSTTTAPLWRSGFGHTVLDPDGKPTGQVTSACHSPTLGCPIALAYVRTPHTTPGT